MSYKRDVLKFAQEHAINLAALRFGVDRKRIREMIRSIDEITASAPTKKIWSGGSAWWRLIETSDYGNWKRDTEMDSRM